MSERKELSLKGHPGIEVIRQLETGIRKNERFERYYVVNKRLYHLIVEMEQGKADRSAVNRFFSSFQIAE